MYLLREIIFTELGFACLKLPHLYRASYVTVPFILILAVFSFIKWAKSSNLLLSLDEEYFLNA